MNSNRRILDLLVPLLDGQVLEQTDMIKKYHVSLRTIQRNLADIRAALTDFNVGDLVEDEGAYRLVRNGDVAGFEKALAVSNMFLGTRALAPDELAATLKFIGHSLSPETQATLHHALAIPRGSYTPLSRPKPLLHRLHEIQTCMAHNQQLTFTYLSSQPNEKRPLTHHAQPVAIFFEMHYFYVAMFSQERGGYWLYRLDRIVAIINKTNGQKLDYAERFSLQDHRHQTYLLDSGSVKKIRFIYRGYVQTALDHFPSAHIIKENADGSHIIDAYVKIDGALLWLVGQGPRLQVLSPKSVVRQVQETLQETLAQYDSQENTKK